MIHCISEESREATGGNLSGIQGERRSLLKKEDRIQNPADIETHTHPGVTARRERNRAQLGIPIDPHDLAVVAMKSSLSVRAAESLFAIDDAMRLHYDALKSTVAASVRPVIVVQNDLQGGTYTLLESDRRTTVQPVPPVFQMVKSVSHAPLALYAIIAPYLRSAPTSAWAPAAKNFRQILEGAATLIEHADLTDAARKSCNTIIHASIEFIDAILKVGKVTPDDFKGYTGPLEKQIATNLDIAAEAQVNAIRELLHGWKARLGHSWRDLYVVVLVIWTTEIDNQHELILRTEMDPSRVQDHLIIISTAASTEDTVEVALDNLGQIVQDNIAASLVFSNPDSLDTLLGRNLKGPQDLLAWSVKRVLKSCPHMHKGSAETRTR